jgi:hypothetical protein
MKPTQLKVEFTKRQLDYLDRMFPEHVGTPDTSHEKFLFHAGQRNVVAALKHLQQKEQP